MKRVCIAMALLVSLAAGAQGALIEGNFFPKPGNTRNAAAATDPDEADGKKFDAKRLVLGGNLGAAFGDITFINVSPQVGYEFKLWLTAGAGVNFLYNSFKERNFDGTEFSRDNFSYAGLNLFARVFPIKFLMISAQPELNYSWGKRKFAGNAPDIKQEGAFVPVFLVGGGVVLPTGGRGGMLISMQYDVIQNPRSPYGLRPFVNVGFTF